MGTQIWINVKQKLVEMWEKPISFQLQLSHRVMPKRSLSRPRLEICLWPWTQFWQSCPIRQGIKFADI